MWPRRSQKRRRRNPLDGIPLGTLLDMYFKVVETEIKHMSEITDKLPSQQVAKQEAQASKEEYIHRVLVAFDQFDNAVFGGHLDETISARAERDALKHEMLAVVLSKVLDFVQRDHGQKAEAGDLERATAIAATEAASLGVPVAPAPIAK